MRELKTLLFESSFAALLKKEFLQLLRNRQLIFMIVLTPVIQLCMYGMALSPEVEHLRLGVLDYSNSPISRDLISAFVRNEVFDLLPSGGNPEKLFGQVRDGELDAGMVIPPEFARKVRAERPTSVQMVLDGVDANTAGIAASYTYQIINDFAVAQDKRNEDINDAIKTNTVFLYNPGLIAAWFFLPGVMGMLLVISGILVSSATLLREKETGTMEQLLMTPVTSAEILLAKIVPLVVVLYANLGVSLAVAMLIFHLPFRGNPLTLITVAFLSIFVVIAVGIALATICSNQRQAMLVAFFINMPTIQLSGAMTPLESMPPFFRGLSLFNPLRYFIVCIKGVLLKGVGLDLLWPSICALLCFAFVLMSVSAYRFRKQLA